MRFAHMYSESYQCAQLSPMINLKRRRFGPVRRSLRGKVVNLRHILPNLDFAMVNNDTESRKLLDCDLIKLPFAILGFVNGHFVEFFY